MTQQSKAVAADTLKAIASALVQVRNLADALAATNNDWQQEVMREISNTITTDWLNSVATMIGYEAINEM